MNQQLLRKPCNDCPFRKNSLKGWLGGVSVQETIQIAHSEYDFQCHKTRVSEEDYEHEEDYLEAEEKIQHCVGRLLYAAKNFKMFRRKDLQELTDELEKENSMDNILNFKEFKEHHGE